MPVKPLRSSCVTAPSTSRPVLKHGGSISTEDAKALAKAQYKIFDQQRKLARKARADAELAELEKVSKGKKQPKKLDEKG